MGPARLLSWNSNSDFLAARSGAELSDKIVEVIEENTRFQYERSLAARSVAERSDADRYLSRGPRAIHIANRRDNAGGNDVAIFSGIKK
jgi:hypothetical protein